MKKFKLLTIFTILSFIGYSQNILDIKRLEVLDSLVCIEDIKDLRANRDTLGIYLVRGKTKLEYLVIKYTNKYDGYYFITEFIKNFENLKKINDEDKLELIYVKNKK